MADNTPATAVGCEIESDDELFESPAELEEAELAGAALTADAVETAEPSAIDSASAIASELRTERYDFNNLI